MKRQILGPLLLLLVIVTQLTSAAAQDVLLGILEESGGHYVGEANYRSVRVVFEKKGDGWQPFPSNCDTPACLKSVTSSYPTDVNWTIAFDGSNVGQVLSRTPSDFRSYGDVGQQTIVSTNPVPTIGARSSEFGGYTEASVYRPLVATSQEYVADPERWKPAAPSEELSSSLRQAFRKKFPRLCRIGATDTGKLEEFPYRDDEVKVVKAYGSVSGSLVARLHLEAIDCQDTEAGFDINDPWFFIDVGKSATYLDSGMWLVDAGDYDNDGKSELVFSINRENEGGYEIWYNRFRSHATFTFSYH
jgi:hypothetical protein